MDMQSRITKTNATGTKQNIRRFLESRFWRFFAMNQWSQIGNVWYYFGSDGYMMTGWRYDDTWRFWFYLDADGSMLNGWQLINGMWYYLNSASEGTNGAMAAHTYIGDRYANAEGVWIP
ncbi:MAG: hypothetical protein HFG14_13660 [Lachnospiraceae bacterium]|jgi:glucan-binding YG repeat protein|nr:hypothetical protein [Lachnospiraceae bacterium]